MFPQSQEAHAVLDAAVTILSKYTKENLHVTYIYVINYLASKSGSIIHNATRQLSWRSGKLTSNSTQICFIVKLVASAPTQVSPLEEIYQTSHTAPSGATNGVIQLPSSCKQTWCPLSVRFTIKKFHMTETKQKLSDCPCVTCHQVLLQFSLQFQLSKTLWSKRRTTAKTLSASTLDQALGIEGGGLRRIIRWSLSISLHLGTKTAPSRGWRSLYLSVFHPRMTRLSLDSLILISLFPFYARLPPFDSPCLVEFMRGSCSRWSPTGWDKSRETILSVPLTHKHATRKHPI